MDAVIAPDIAAAADAIERAVRTCGAKLVALAGLPGAGKSTVAAALQTRGPDAAVLPMDGYHFADARRAMRES